MQIAFKWQQKILMLTKKKHSKKIIIKGILIFFFISIVQFDCLVLSEAFLKAICLVELFLKKLVSEDNFVKMQKHKNVINNIKFLSYALHCKKVFI